MLLAPRPAIKLQNHQLSAVRATYVLRYSRLTSISAGCLLHAPSNYAQSRGDRDSVIMNVTYLFPKTHINSLVTACCDADEQTENILKKMDNIFMFKINRHEIAIYWLHKTLNRLYSNVSSIFRN